MGMLMDAMDKRREKIDDLLVRLGDLKVMFEAATKSQDYYEMDNLFGEIESVKAELVSYGVHVGTD